MTLAVAMTGCGMMNAQSRNALGKHQFKKGNYAEAARHFNMAAIDDPQNADYLQNLATAYWKVGNPQQAEQYYRQALNVDPMHQQSYHSLARLMNSQGRNGEAASLLAMWSDTQPYIAEPKIELAWLNREMGNHVAAEQNLRQALQIEPANATALAHLGQVFQDQGRHGEAVAMYQRSLYQDFRQPEVKSRIASLTGSQHAIGRPSVFAGTPTVVASQPVAAPVVAWVPSGTTNIGTAQQWPVHEPQWASADADPAHPAPQVAAGHNGPIVDAH